MKCQPAAAMIPTTATTMASVVPHSPDWKTQMLGPIDCLDLRAPRPADPNHADSDEQEHPSVGREVGRSVGCSQNPLTHAFRQFCRTSHG